MNECAKLWIPIPIFFDTLKPFLSTITLVWFCLVVYDSFGILVFYFFFLVASSFFLSRLFFFFFYCFLKRPSSSRARRHRTERNKNINRKKMQVENILITISGLHLLLLCPFSNKQSHKLRFGRYKQRINVSK